jgi:hypothetical protein
MLMSERRKLSTHQSRRRSSANKQKMEAADLFLEVGRLDGSSLRIACLNEDNIGALMEDLERVTGLFKHVQTTYVEDGSDQPLDVDVSLVTLDGRKIYLIAKSDPYCLLFTDMDAEDKVFFKTLVFEEGEHAAAMQKYEKLGQATEILRMAPAVEPGVRVRATATAATTVVRSSFEEEETKLVSVMNVRKILSVGRDPPIQAV